MLDCAHWIAKSWNDTKSSTIQSCFVAAGFPLQGLDQSSSESDSDDIPLAQLITGHLALGVTENTITDLENTENDIPIEENYDGEWEKQIVAEHKQSLHVENKSSDEDNDEPDDDNSQGCTNYTDVLECLNKIEKFAKLRDDDYLTTIQDLKAMTENKIVAVKSKTSQRTLDPYFKK